MWTTFFCVCLNIAGICHGPDMGKCAKGIIHNICLFLGGKYEVLLYDTLVLCFCKYRIVFDECRVSNAGLKLAGTGCGKSSVPYYLVVEPNRYECQTNGIKFNTDCIHCRQRPLMCTAGKCRDLIEQANCKTTEL